MSTPEDIVRDENSRERICKMPTRDEKIAMCIELQRQYGWTPARIAQVLNLPTSTVSRWLAKYANASEAPTHVQTKPPSNGPSEASVEKYADLPRRGVEHVVSEVKSLLEGLYPDAWADHRLRDLFQELEQRVKS